MATKKTLFPGSGIRAFAILFLMAAPAIGVSLTIKPGEIWRDDRSLRIQAHGGGILRFRGIYYWFGEDRSQDLDPAKRYVSCYSSKDLVNWTFRNEMCIRDSRVGERGGGHACGIHRISPRGHDVGGGKIRYLDPIGRNVALSVELQHARHVNDARYGDAGERAAVAVEFVHAR